MLLSIVACFTRIVFRWSVERSRTKLAQNLLRKLKKEKSFQLSRSQLCLSCWREWTWENKVETKQQSLVNESTLKLEVKIDFHCFIMAEAG